MGTGGIRVRMEYFDCDFTRFASISRNVQFLTPQIAEELTEALRLYRGGYLEMNEFQWTLQRTIRFKTLYVKLVQRVMEFYRKQGKEGDAQNLLWESVSKVPSSDNLTCLLLASLLKTGNSVQAQKLFETYQKKCIEEFDCEPADRIIRLFR